LVCSGTPRQWPVFLPLLKFPSQSFLVSGFVRSMAEPSSNELLTDHLPLIVWAHHSNGRFFFAPLKVS
jgi:hypothetical protein